MATDPTKRDRLLDAGWKEGSAQDLLGLTEEETKLVEERRRGHCKGWHRCGGAVLFESNAKLDDGIDLIVDASAKIVGPDSISIAWGVVAEKVEGAPGTQEHVPVAATLAATIGVKYTGTILADSMKDMKATFEEVTSVAANMAVARVRAAMAVK